MDEIQVPEVENPAEVIAGLEGQPAPEGVADDVWEKLTAELVRVLGKCGHADKLACTPPSGESGAVTLEYIPASMALEWLYVNTGDYDQNGVVGISDLTPLGLHFGESSEGGPGQPFDPTAVQWMIDGDGNGVIDLGDITPIGANFGTTVEGYRIYYSENEEDYPAGPDAANGPGTTGLVVVPTWSGDEALGRKRFTHQVSPGAVSRHHWVRPYHGVIEGSASNSVTVSSQFPVADLAADVTEGHAPLRVTFDASGSTDPDGSIVRYDYDFDNNGAWDAYDAGSSISHQYGVPGMYNAMVRVTDDDWHQDSAVLEITVTEPPNQPPVAELEANITEGDVPLNVIFNASGSTDPDGTIVAYDWDFDGDGTYDASGSNPTYEHLYEDYGEFEVELKVTDDDGATDFATMNVAAHSWIFVLPDVAAIAAGSTSLAVVDGNPAICYASNAPDLRYARASTATGVVAADWQVLIVDGGISSDPSFSVVEGNPAIAYYESVNNEHNL